MATAFRTSNKQTDPETGTVSWDVQYTPVKEFRSSLDELSQKFKKLIDQHPQDEKLYKTYEFFTKFKKHTLSYLTRQYGK